MDEGTVLAHLNDSLLKARVNQAKASLARVEAEQEKASVKMKQADKEFGRAKRLHESKGDPVAGVRRRDVRGRDGTIANLAAVKGDLQLAQANLEEAQVNLGYATIKSPVKGVILDRRVNIGQTVVASLNAPSLFLIAKDLSRIEVWASVNETDVGAIHNGQGVRFTVGAFPKETFRGKVSQIRLNASMTQNVVTYTVVVQVDNIGGKLLPYLTARLQFEVEDRTTRCCLSRTPPCAGSPRSIRSSPRPAPASPPRFARRPSARSQRNPGPSPRPKRGSRAQSGSSPASSCDPIEVTAGLTDGVNTEIVSGKVDKGTEVVLGLIQQGGDGEGASPFLPSIKNDKAKK